MIKRAMDLVLSSLLLLALAPLLALTWVLVRCKLGAPAVFTQERAGLGGRSFTLYKFRTMTDAVDADGKPLPDELRLTRFGAFIRQSSLDELPQLVNVLVGDMSLVGPRPLHAYYLDRYTPEQARRHQVRPGITGWAQVRGRNALDWDAKFALDTWYVDHRSCWLDVRILLLTAWKVVHREGVNAAGAATMTEFMGTQAPPADPTKLA